MFLFFSNHSNSLWNIDYSIGTYEYNMLHKIYVCMKRIHYFVRNNCVSASENEHFYSTNILGIYLYKYQFLGSKTHPLSAYET
jgi:hypothetical protein